MKSLNNFIKEAEQMHINWSKEADGFAFLYESLLQDNLNRGESLYISKANACKNYKEALSNQMLNVVF